MSRLPAPCPSGGVSPASGGPAGGEEGVRQCATDNATAAHTPVCFQVWAMRVGPPGPLVHATRSSLLPWYSQYKLSSQTCTSAVWSRQGQGPCRGQAGSDGWRVGRPAVCRLIAPDVPHTRRTTRDDRFATRPRTRVRPSSRCTPRQATTFLQPDGCHSSNTGCCMKRSDRRRRHGVPWRGCGGDAATTEVTL